MNMDVSDVLHLLFLSLFLLKLPFFFKQFQCIQSPLTLQEKLKKREEKDDCIQLGLISPFKVLEYELRMR